MSLNFRNEARNCLGRAREELATNNDKRLRYATFELRMCVEAITYASGVESGWRCA